MRNIKLMADYDSYPLWDEDNIDNLNPDDPPISEELKRKIHKWEDHYDSTLNRENPANSGFASDEELRVFEQEGCDLWRQLREELGDTYVVKYFSQESGSVMNA